MHVNVNNFECIMAETIYLYYLHIDGESMTNATWCIELLIQSVVQTIPRNVAVYNMRKHARDPNENVPRRMLNSEQEIHNNNNKNTAATVE